MSKETALITGASSGIGLALAHEFAKHGHPLVLTARVESELQAVREELRAKHGIDVQVIGKDLEAANAVRDIYEEVRLSGRRIDILVNNAGLGQKGKFWEIPIEKDLSMVRVNIETVLRLTKLFLPEMVKRNSGRIMNTASIAGFEPGPLLAVYHATKAFLLSFSEALATELEETKITVTALCPGATDTDFFPKADMVDTKMFQKGNVMAPAEVAEIGYKAMMKGERVIVPGGGNKALAFARRVLPESAQAKMNEKFYSDVEASERKRERGDIESDPKKN